MHSSLRRDALRGTEGKGIKQRLETIMAQFQIIGGNTKIEDICIKAYPVDSGSATCCGLNDRIRSVAGTTIDG
jgi:hypothetical protein